jgi:RND family efflux transporter MFP subunit
MVAVAVAADPPRPVTAVRAGLAPVESRLELTGTVTANRRSQLSPSAEGLIASMRVDAGARVKKGDVLMELDRELGELALERIRVELERARIELADAERRVAEVRELVRGGGFPRSEAESLETTVRVSGSDVRRLEILEKEQAAVLERHRLVAPYDGVVSRKLADEGEWVETGTPVVELVELADPRLDVQAPQEAFARLAGEVGVKVWLDAFPGRELGGKIGVKVPVKDGVSRTFLIRIHLDDPEKLAAPGMSARAVLTFRGGEPVVQVPRDAVVRFPDGSAKVWTIREEGSAQVAEARDVTLGDSLAGTVGILAGIAEGALVVVRGNEGLRDGQAVEVLSESTSGKP